MNTSIQWMLVCTLLITASTNGNQQSKTDSATAALSPADQFKKITEESHKAWEASNLAYQNAKTDEERKKLARASPHWSDPFLHQALTLARAHPNDPAAVEALVWIVMNFNLTREAVESVALLRQKYIESEKLSEVCQMLGDNSLDPKYDVDPKQVEPFLREAMEKSPHHSVRGQACFGLAQYIRLWRSPSEGEKEQTATYEALYERVISEFRDLRHERGTLGEAAKAALFAIRNLGLGHTAPEIKGEDVDGKKFKLSDYRGKVVVIDFWGDW